MPTNELHPENDAESISEKKGMHLVSKPEVLENFKNEYSLISVYHKGNERQKHPWASYMVNYKDWENVKSFFGLSHIN